MNDLVEEALVRWLKRHENDAFRIDDRRKPKRERVQLQVEIDAELKSKCTAVADRNVDAEPKRFPSSVTYLAEEAIEEFLRSI